MLYLHPNKNVEYSIITLNSNNYSESTCIKSMVSLIPYWITVLPVIYYDNSGTLIESNMLAYEHILTPPHGFE